MTRFDILLKIVISYPSDKRSRDKRARLFDISFSLALHESHHSSSIRIDPAEFETYETILHSGFHYGFRHQFSSGQHHISEVQRGVYHLDHVPLIWSNRALYPLEGAQISSYLFAQRSIIKRKKGGRVHDDNRETRRIFFLIYRQ